MIKSIDVNLWGRKVGTLVESPDRYKTQICFYFDSEFITLPLNPFPLRAPVAGVAAQRGLPVYPDSEKIFGGLPSFIADSLPDHWGNLLFSQWAKSNRIRQRDLSVLDRLAYIGKRGMGALEFQPSMNKNLEQSFKVEIESLVSLAELAGKMAKNIHVSLSEDLAIESLFKVGTSAGGRWPKAVINYNPITGECYSGQVETDATGCVPMILKFDEHGDIPSTRIEYSYYLMAREAGICMMPSRLLELAGSTHFLTERFDRNNGGKIHVQTLAAMNPASTSYEDLFETARKLDLPPLALQQLFRQMVINVLAGNVDDHSKNFSFLMDREGHWSAAPMYDFTFTVEPSAPAYVNRHSMTINNNNLNITREDLLAVAELYNIKSPDAVIAEISKVVRSYSDFAATANVPLHWVEFINSEIQQRITALMPQSL